MSLLNTLATGGIIYMIVCGVIWSIKWICILFWPALIIEGCAQVFGSSIQNWAEGARTFVMVISLIIGFCVYRLYKSKQAEGSGNSYN